MPVKSLNTVFLVLTLAGCVTVNVAVTFPAADLQMAADKIVGDIQEDTGESSSGRGSAGRAVLYACAGPLLLAQADEEPPEPGIDMTITNAKIDALKRRMTVRFPAVKALKNVGAVGEGLRGYLEIREQGFDVLALQQKGKAKRLLAAENQDRKALYLELLSANELPTERLPDLERIFARSWYRAAEKSWYLRKTKESWITKEQWQKEREEREAQEQKDG